MCNSKGFFKRILPFFATFAVGVLIASFFVGFNGPGFRKGAKKHHEMKRLRIENEELRNENLRLKNEMESQRWNGSHPGDFTDGHWAGPDVPVAPPPPPVAPRVKR